MCTWCVKIGFDAAEDSEKTALMRALRDKMGRDYRIGIIKSAAIDQELEEVDDMLEKHPETELLFIGSDREKAADTHLSSFMDATIHVDQNVTEDYVYDNGDPVFSGRRLGEKVASIESWIRSNVLFEQYA